MIPVWLLMLGIYWDSLLRYRKRGRRLAEVLLEKLRQVGVHYRGQQMQQELNQIQIKEFHRPILLQPLADRLSYSIRKLVLEHTSSLVLPESWTMNKDLLFSCLKMEEIADKSIFASLAERNARIQLPKAQPESTQQSAQHRVVQLLDSLRTSPDLCHISTACLNMLEDRLTLVTKLLEWCATPFRSGLCRVFAAARLLRKWKISGIDIETYIILFLSTVQDTAQLMMENVYHVVSELVRSQTFSISRYLQWLMAKGVSRSLDHNGNGKLSSDIRLLAQLPTGRLPEHIRNLRLTLLGRAGMQALEEKSTVEHLKASITHRMPRIFQTDASSTTCMDLSQLNLTWAVKSEISMWIRQGISRHFRDAVG